MPRLKKSSSQQSKKAEPKVNISIKHNDGSVEDIEKSPFADIGVKHNMSYPTLGMSKGVTKNMGDFESLRVDVWLALPVEDTDTESIKEKYNEIERAIDDVLETTVLGYISPDE